MARQPALTIEERRAILDKLPDFIEPRPGFKFVWDNSVVIVVGWGGWREHKHVGFVRYTNGKDQFNVSMSEAQFHKPGLLGTYAYKGEWYLCDISKLENINEAQTWHEYMDDNPDVVHGDKLHGADMI